MLASGCVVVRGAWGRCVFSLRGPFTLKGLGVGCVTKICVCIDSSSPKELIFSSCNEREFCVGLFVPET